MDFHMHFDDFLWNSLKQIHHPGTTEVTTPIIMVWVWESRLPPSWVSNLAPVGRAQQTLLWNWTGTCIESMYWNHVHICRMSCFQMFVNFLQESYRSFIQMNLNGMNPNSISLIGIGVCQRQSWETKFHRFQVVRGCDDVCVSLIYNIYIYIYVCPKLLIPNPKSSLSLFIALSGNEGIDTKKISPKLVVQTRWIYDKTPRFPAFLVVTWGGLQGPNWFTGYTTYLA